MPLRPVNRDQGWLPPPTLDELLSQDHPARFIAALVEGLDSGSWEEMEIDLDGAPPPLGATAPAHPLLRGWHDQA